MGASKKLFIKTYGCQMNVYDSARMEDVLKPLGYEMTEGPEDANMVILNTCHIREKASEKVYSELGRLKNIKKKRDDENEMIIGVAGCVAQAEGEEISKRAPYVDMVFGPQSYHNLPEMIAKAHRAGDEKGRGILMTEFPAEDKFDHLPEPTKPEGYSAFLSIQEGCDKFCTYCVVPYTRGAEYSRPAEHVLKEARQLVAQGALEITLLGQNVNAYHGDDGRGGEWSLGRLIRELAEIDGLERIRYTTSYPAEVDDDLITAHAEVPQLMPYLHLPVQSGSNRVLAAMNRNHTREEYLEIIAKLKAARPDLALSSDFIVGFPGENERDFEDTLDIIRDVKFIQAFSFVYSARPGTPAATMDLQVDKVVANERLQILQKLLVDIQTDFNQNCIGRKFPILLEREGRNPGQLVGRSPYMQPVHVDAPLDLIGKIADLKIISARPTSLGAELVNVERKHA
ncbi:tRNA (N6-isopentenyl adenosine(37)-C2)-methylthiotransferase MiaB [Terasakiella sp. SH-1]|uniref:tRNA (N6-isopentenyl adenosine(37)-C2)-methylthiotransferase MiaB n=1 Tax=Terasakiella sp. SH-1 TaxID=2560057 RepID=UPI00107425A1|nr:tRNA (N6-isopentenyl adenosine(37)-C2)-methylthiotransferase MiaB [Terasakiella sp. SH-1]